MKTVRAGIDTSAGLPPVLLCTIALGPALLAQGATSADARIQSWEQHVAMAAESPFRQLTWRALGPKFQGGRIEAIASPRGRSKTIYVGVGSGGVFKTTDEGRTWTSLFDRESTTAIGSIAVAASEPETIWVGTGETHPSGTSFPGSGIFKSTDGGASWRNMGLHDSHHIARICIHPKDASIVYAGVMGHHRSRNAERGVFRSRDGGESWERVLYVSESVGIVDLVMAPSNPSTLFAATWDRGGGASAIHRSRDGGSTWTRLSTGLPAGRDTGRISVDVSHQDEDHVFALLVNRKLAKGRRPGGAEVYRSTNGGESFARTHESALGTWIGWDFCDLRVTPQNAEHIYLCGQVLLRSQDGGKNFARVTKEARGNNADKIERLHPHQAKLMHLDMHEIVFDAAKPGRILLATDGGLYVSKDHAASWLHVNNLPIGEFYELHLDDAEPYRIWGGTQDNASLYGPSDTVVDSRSPDPWKHVFLDRWGGGDGFVTRPDPSDPKFAYIEQQNGVMWRKQLDGPVRLGRGDRRIRPRGKRGAAPLRFAWNTPLLVSHHEPRTLYCAAQRVLKSENRGKTWTTISPDLARRDILSLSESPLQRGLLFAAHGAGKVHVTRDDGANWHDISKGLAKKRVTRVLASRHDKNGAYITLSGVGRDECAPYVYRSSDGGKTWKAIADGLPLEPVFAIAEDPVHSGVLYVGTMLGVYVTLDAGATWNSLCTGLPAVPVFDMAVHPRAHELVIATHGRSVFACSVRSIHAAARQR